MKERIFEFGETHPVEVISVYTQVLAVKATDTGEGFILLGLTFNPRTKKGEKGKIVFEKGGPKGGYWQYYPNAENFNFNKP